VSTIKHQLYVDTTMRLAKSIVLKDESVASAINEDVNVKGISTGFVVDQRRPETWKYYLNLAGRYHPMDVPMTIVSLDTSESINFDVSTLQLHRSTLKAYRQDSRYYADILERYPDQELLISGILNPVDITKAIAAANYTILHYSEDEVEPQETNLILRLQDWIYSFARRWYVRDYQITDSLFNSAFLGILYSQIPGMIISLRQSSVRTYQAHSFHVWSYLESTGRLSRFRRYLTDEQQMWLYRNIRWVLLNAGRNSTFESLVENLLSKRSIPIGQYHHRLNLTGMATDIIGKPELERTPLNLFEVVTRAKPIRSIDYVLEKEMPLARDNRLYLEEHQAFANNVFSKTFAQEGPSRVMESEMIDRSQVLPITLTEFQIQHWMYLAFSGKYLATINVDNPYSTEPLKMSASEAVILWFYVGVKIAGIQLNEIPTLIARIVRRTPLPSVALLRGQVGPLVSDDDIRKVLSEHSAIPDIVSTETFYHLTQDLHQVYLSQHRLINSVHHHKKRAEMDMTVMGCYQDYICRFPTYATYGEFFNAKGWKIDEIPLTDLNLLYEKLSTVAIGADLGSTISLKDVQAAMLQLMRQLSAYSTQIIQTINTRPATVIEPPFMRPGTTTVVGSDTVRADQKILNSIKLWVTTSDRLRLNSPSRVLTTHVFMRERNRSFVPMAARIGTSTSIRETIKFKIPKLTFKSRNLGRDIVDDWFTDPKTNYVEPSYDVNFTLTPDGIELFGAVSFTTQQVEKQYMSVTGSMEQSAEIGFAVDMVQSETMATAGTLEMSGGMVMTFAEYATVNAATDKSVGVPRLDTIVLTAETVIEDVMTDPLP